MQDIIITNNHLKDVMEILKEYLEEEKDAPVELVAKFICELKVSNLLIPAVEEEDAFAFEHITSEADGSTFLPLFTDIEEYNKHEVENDEFSPMAFEFDVYSELVLENDLEGIVLNVEGDFIPLDEKFIKNIENEIDIDVDDTVEKYTAPELRDIFENVSNEALVEFINDAEAQDDIERLYVELSNSTMLNIVINDEPLDGFATDGIIASEDVDGFILCTVEDGEHCFGAIFTDKNAIEKAINPDSGLYHYGQVTLLSEFFDFILRSDMDGVIINPNSDDYVIARDDILPQATGVEIIDENPSFDDCLEYAFLL